MNWPPLWMRLRIHNEDTKLGLWLPLFLLIPFVIVALIILSPFLLIATLILWPMGWGRPALMIIPVVWSLYCSVRGLRVDVQGRREMVYISVV